MIISEKEMGVTILVILLLVNEITGLEELPCHFLDSINITGGVLNADKSILFGKILYPPSQYATIDYILEEGIEPVTVDSYIRGCVCNIKPCLRLCCPLGSIQSMKDNGSVVCQNHDTAKNFKAEVLHENNETKILHLDQYFGYVEGRPCKFEYTIDDNHTITHVRIIIAIKCDWEFYFILNLRNFRKATFYAMEKHSRITIHV